MPAFLLHRDQALDIRGFGGIRFDVAYGGAFHAVAEAGQFGLAFGRSRSRDFVDAATVLTKAVQAALPITYPEEPDLGFLYGPILTDGPDRRRQSGAGGAATRNVCVFADADRSPAGSGVTARLALTHARGEVALGEPRLFESVAGSRFTGSVLRQTKAGPHEAIVARVGGGLSIPAAPNISGRKATSWAAASCCGESARLMREASRPECETGYVRS